MTYRNSSWTGRAPRTLESASGFAHRSSVAVIEPMRTVEPRRRRLQDRVVLAVGVMAMAAVGALLVAEQVPASDQVAAVEATHAR